MFGFFKERKRKFEAAIARRTLRGVRVTITHQGHTFVDCTMLELMELTLLSHESIIGHSDNIGTVKVVHDFTGLHGSIR